MKAAAAKENRQGSEARGDRSRSADPDLQAVDAASTQALTVVDIRPHLPVEGAEAPADLAAVNERSILGHMGVQSNGEVYYRVMWPVPKGMPIVASVLIEVLQLLVAGSDMALGATT